ncbi:MAG: hypothetical protein ABFR75_00245 [Acidobacteriota bacterium]
MNMLKNCSLFILFFLFYSLIFSHSITYKNINGGIGLQVNYDSGDPVSEADVQIFSPTDRELIFQHLSTDINGRFLFYPDKTGKWKINVNDGMGHGLVKEIIIENLQTKKISETEHPEYNRFHKIVIGVSIIFGLTGILFFLSAKKYLKRSNNAHP